MSTFNQEMNVFTVLVFAQSVLTMCKKFLCSSGDFVFSLKASCETATFSVTLQYTKDISAIVLAV